MSQYALLLLPSANRVYSGSAIGLTQAELALLGGTVLDGTLADIGTNQIGGVPYVTFEAARLRPADLVFVARLSSAYALFEQVGELLRPVPLPSQDRFDDDLLTIMKYQGKTNEQFTKLLLNVTLLSSAFARGLPDRNVGVLDPLCGRGSTLNQALMYGFDAAGIDADGKDFDAYAAFIRTWLQRKRIKHKAELVPVRRERKLAGRRLEVTLAAQPADYKAGRTQLLQVVHADTVRALEFFRPQSFDLLVADTPYGVQHGSTTRGDGLARSPLQLLAAAAGRWAELLRPGGAAGLAVNTLVASRDAVAQILADAGLEPLTSEPYLRFQHRVDQAIMRDIVIARKQQARPRS